jgi:hypothetical protein
MPPTPEELVEQVEKARAGVARIVRNSDAMVLASRKVLAEYCRIKMPLATEIIRFDEIGPADM